MGDLTDKAFETDAIVLNETLGLFAGSSTPGVDAPDAPQGSVYYRSNGDRYTRTENSGSGVEDDWILEDPSATAGAGAVSLSWRFSTTTTESDPGSKRIRFDNATPASVTELFISDTTNGNFDASTLLNALVAGDRIYVQQANLAASFLLCTVVTVVDNTGWFSVAVTIDASGTLPANNSDLAVLLFLGGGGGGGGIPAEQDFALVERQAAFNIPINTPTLVPMDATIEETDPSVIEHDNVLTSRLILHEIGTYLIGYSAPIDIPTPADANVEIISQVRLNGGSGIAGSHCENSVFNDASIIGSEHEDTSKATFVIRTTVVDSYVELFIWHIDKGLTAPTVEIEAGIAAEAAAFWAVRMKGTKGDVGAPGGAQSDQASVHAERTTTLAYTTSFMDVTLDATPFENDPAVVEHNNTLTDRLDLKETGPYWITYKVNNALPAGSVAAMTIEGRVTVNDGGAAETGSESEAEVGGDGSLVGDQTFAGQLTAGFPYDATAGDFLTLQIQKTESDTGVCNAVGVTFTATRMTGATGATGAPGSGDSTFRIGHTYAISGEVKVPSGDVDFVLPFFVSIAPGQTISLVKARHVINSGTSVTAKLQINDVDATGFVGISVTTAEADTDPADIILSDNDKIALVVTGVAGTPTNMSFTVFVESTN